MHAIESYASPNKVLVGNGHSLVVKTIGHSQMHSNFVSNSMLKLYDVSHVPNIIRNLIYVSMPAKDNQVYCEFHANNYFIKSQASEQVLLDGFLDESGLYFFNDLLLGTLRHSLGHMKSILGLEVHNTTVLKESNNANLILYLQIKCLFCILG